MIIVKLQGGLGNQLFQYAFGLAVATQLQTRLLFDITAFKNQNGLTPRSFELNKLLNANISIATEKQIQQATRHSVLRRLLYKPTYFKERSLRFDENVFSVKSPAYFEGFWQSESYFKLIENDIYTRLCQYPVLNEQSDKVKEAISQQTAVSVHVRRGDYVNSKSTHDLHGVCSLAYYKKAIDLITQKVTDAHFYFFSDDPKWVEENLLPSTTNATLVSHNKNEDSWQDMILMSNCHHHIIANSSFSWWGAWLNNNEDKIVIAPQKWFRSPTAYFDDADIVPERWIKLPND